MASDRARFDRPESGSPTQADSAAETFQPDEVWERFGGDLDLIQEILGLIERDLPEYLVRLQGTLDAGDLPAAARLAHTIKGTVGEVAAVRLPGLAVSIEQAALRSDRGAAAALVPGMKTAASQLLAALRTWRAEVLAGRG
jgi:HPt (histidine-containing phosphotransfer) domain-containing protein